MDELTNQQILKQIKIDYGLTRQQMADLISAPLSTMHNWLNPPSSKSARACPDYIIELMMLKLKRKKKVNK